MHVERPWWLVALLLLAAPWVWPWARPRVQALVARLRASRQKPGSLGRRGPGATGYDPTTRRGSYLPKLGLRPVVAGLLILALAGLSISLPARHQAVLFLADRSASAGAAQKAEIDWLQQALALVPKQDQAGVLSFARETQLEIPVGPKPPFQSFGAVLDDSQTDISRALTLGAAVLPSGFRQHLVLMSDGRENLGSALLTAQKLHEQGVTVDVVPMKPPTGVEALIKQVDAPAGLRKGEAFTSRITLSSTVDQLATLRIYDDKTLVQTKEIKLVAGDETLPIRLENLGPGYHKVWFTLAPQQDTLSQNNEAAALVNVEGPPKVLVVEAEGGASANVKAALLAMGYTVDVVTPDAVPTHAATLQTYGSVVLTDVPAAALPRDAIAALSSYVKDAGRGLLVLGGQNSFSMGGYAGTPLEDLMPVRMDIPQKKKIPTVAVVLVVENLEVQDKINLSKEAAKGILGLLGPRDQIAVNDAASGFAVPMQFATDKAKISQLIDAMQTGDPPSYIPYLEQAAKALRETQAEVKHMIFVGDGDAQGGSFAQYQAAISAIAKDGITLSTVETNAANPAEFMLVEEMARWGKGRSYHANDAAAIPRIFMKEAQQTARPAVVEETFVPTITSRSPILTGITQMAPLHGYIAVTPKATAEVALSSPESDPVLAQWQTGLGRVVAWTSDAAGLWTNGFVQTPGFAQLMAQAVGWTLPPPGEKGLQVSAAVAGGKAHVSVQLPAPVGGGQPDWPISLVAGVIAPDAAPRVVTLPASGPGLYEGEMPAAQAGPYLLKLSAVRGNTSVPVGEMGVVVPYSAEFQVAGPDEALLRRIAEVGGGQVLSGVADAWRLPATSAAGRYPLAQALLLLAALLWPVDIALRRLRPGREEWQALGAWLAFWRRRRQLAGVPTATGQAVAGVKRRREAYDAPAAGAAAGAPVAAQAPFPAPEAQSVPTPAAQPSAAPSAAPATPVAPAAPAAKPAPSGGAGDSFTQRLLERRRQQGQ